MRGGDILPTESGVTVRASAGRGSRGNTLHSDAAAAAAAGAQQHQEQLQQLITNYLARLIIFIISFVISST